MGWAGLEPAAPLPRYKTTSSTKEKNTNNHKHWCNNVSGTLRELSTPYVFRLPFSFTGYVHGRYSLGGDGPMNATPFGGTHPLPSGVGLS